MYSTIAWGVTRSKVIAYDSEIIINNTHMASSSHWKGFKKGVPARHWFAERSENLREDETNA